MDSSQSLSSSIAAEGSPTLIPNPSAAERDGAAFPSSNSLQDEKVSRILQACKEKDIRSLVDLACTAHGLVKDEIRRIAWPILLGSSKHLFDKQSPWDSLPVHRDEAQVQLDVDRSFVYYPKTETQKAKDDMKKSLSNVITEVLRRYPNLSYFQGYHDIVQVVLLVLGPQQAAYTAARLSMLKIRDFMLPSMSGAIAHLHLLPPIIYSADRDLFQHLNGAQPFFALAATLTLYAHDIQEYGDIARLFDFLLAKEAVLSVYLYAAIIISRKDELLDVPRDEPEMQHFVLSKLPQPLDLDSLITRSMKLYASFPPEKLPFRAWAKVSSHSVLKTTGDPLSVHAQTFEEAQICFEKQAAEIRRQEMVRKAFQSVRRMAWIYRRPASAFGLAVAVGILAWWMGRSGGGAVWKSPMTWLFGDWTRLKT